MTSRLRQLLLLAGVAAATWQTANALTTCRRVGATRPVLGSEFNGCQFHVEQSRLGNFGYGLNVSGSMVLSGSVSLARTPISASYTVTDFDYLVAVRVVSPSVVVTLPPADEGRFLVVKDEACGATANPITLTASSNIDNLSAGTTISSDCGAARLYAGGSQWWTW